MASATTFLNFMTQLAVEPGLLAVEIEGRFIYKVNAVEITTTTVTTRDPNIMKLTTQQNPVRLRGWHIYLETNAEERVIDSMSSTVALATLTIAGANATAVAAGSTNVWLSQVP